MAKKRVNDTGMKYKMEALKALPVLLSGIAHGGAELFQEKLKDEIANKPMSSPQGEVGGGYIRRITGAFNTDVAHVTRVGEALYLVGANAQGVSRPYFMDVWNWSKKKYGYTPHEIVRGKYTKHFIKGMTDSIRDFVQAFNTNPKRWRFETPFVDLPMEPSINPKDAS